MEKTQRKFTVNKNVRRYATLGCGVALLTVVFLATRTGVTVDLFNATAGTVLTILGYYLVAIGSGEAVHGAANGVEHMAAKK